MGDKVEFLTPGRLIGKDKLADKRVFCEKNKGVYIKCTGGTETSENLIKKTILRQNRKQGRLNRTK